MESTQPPPIPRPLLKRIFISPDEPRLRAGWRLLGQIVVLIVLAIVVSIPMILLAQPLELDWPGADRLIDQIITLLAITFSIYLARRILDRRSFVSLGLKLDSRALWDVLIGIGIAAVMMILIYALEWSFGWLTFQGFAWDTQPDQVVFLGTLSMLVVFVSVGWTEELFSRGYQMQNLVDGLNLTWGVILSSSIFALLHLGNPNASWASTLGLLLAGLFLAYGYLATRQLWLPIGLHIGWNFFEGTVFGFPVSGLEAYRLVLHSVDGPDLITGGAFGPEAGLILLPALALGTALIYGYTKVWDSRQWALNAGA